METKLLAHQWRLKENKKYNNKYKYKYLEGHKKS